jgi:multidrug efflux pump subunit AcrA (membrane-fusion protein)
MSRSGRLVGTLLLTGALAIAGAGCGESPEDNAKDHGEDVGEAFRDLTNARSAQEIEDAAVELKDAVAAVGDSGGDEVQQQLNTQQANIDAAIAAVKSALAAGDVAGAQTALQSQLQEVRAQAQSFRSSNDSVANAFWSGVKEGYDDD